uniref:Uncharacterized protein n=1 Tax=Arion vulgaris TaxID=1028688 RepID=A0A0B7B8T4_9EUPU
MTNQVCMSCSRCGHLCNTVVDITDKSSLQYRSHHNSCIDVSTDLHVKLELIYS